MSHASTTFSPATLPCQLLTCTALAAALLVETCGLIGDFRSAQASVGNNRTVQSSSIPVQLLTLRTSVSAAARASTGAAANGVRTSEEMREQVDRLPDGPASEPPVHARRRRGDYRSTATTTVKRSLRNRLLLHPPGTGQHFPDLVNEH